MRLNRVLQMTAAIGMTVAATIFTISCGEDGAEGNPGTGCSITGSESPYTVICNGVEKGQLFDGVQGDPGKTQNGATGPQGQSCSVSPSGESSYTVSCGGSVQGSLDACDVKSVSLRETTISCGATTISLCDVEVFDPSKKYCPVSGAASDLSANLCGPDYDIPFNPDTKYCGYANEADFKNKIPSVLDLCSSTLPVSATSAMKPNEAIYTSASSTWGSPTTGYVADGVFDALGSASSAYGTSWRGEYCQVKRSVTNNVLTEVKRKVPAVVAAGDTVNSLCNGVLEKMNENTWNRQYCGYGKANDASKSVLSNACGTGVGPWETAFGKTYCAVKKKTDKYTDTSATYCEVGTGSSKRNETLNASDKITALTANDWGDQYCGYEAADKVPTTSPSYAGEKSVRTGTCDKDSSGVVWTGSPLGPNNTTSTTASSGWMNEYCQSLGPTKGDSTKLVGISHARTFAAASTIYCKADTTALPTGGFAALITGTKVDSIYAKLGSDKRLNEGSWKGEYCGFSQKNDVKADAAFSVLKGTCDYDSTYASNGAFTGLPLGPNNVATTTIANGWMNQYCQAIDKTGKTRIAGAVATSLAPSFANSVRAYCLRDTTTASGAQVVDKYLVASSDARLNEGSWKGEYCGFENAAGVGKTGTKATFAKLSGYCDEGLSSGSAAEPPNKVNPTAQSVWTAQYCQVQSKSSPATKLVDLTFNGISASPSHDDTLSAFTKIYCVSDTSVAAFSSSAVKPTGNFLKAVIDSIKAGSFTGTVNKLNEKTWDPINGGEYCGFSSKADFDLTDGANPPVRIGKFSVLKSVCTSVSGGTMKGPNHVTNTSWNNEYCTALDRETPNTTTIASGKTAYCYAPPAGSTQTWADAGGESRLNENGWKGEYCFKDDVKGTCSGGQTPIANAVSTDNPKCKW